MFFKADDSVAHFAYASSTYIGQLYSQFILDQLKILYHISYDSFELILYIAETKHRKDRYYHD